MSNILKRVSVRSTPKVIETPNLNRHEPPKAAVQLAAAGAAAASAKTALEDARAAARNTVAAAEKQAAAIMDEAGEAAEELKAKAREQGFAEGREAGLEDGRREGYEQGRKEGEEAGMAMAAQAIEEAARQARSTISVAEEQARQTLLGAERQIVDMALTLARKILAREIEENPMAVLPIVQAALGRVRDQEQITLRVNPQDYELVLLARHELQAALQNDNSLTIAPDDTLKNGDCVIDTPYGNLDARIDTQFEILKNALRDITP